MAGQLQTREAGDGTRLEIDGHLVPDTSDPTSSLSIADIAHDIAFVGGHKAFSRARLAVTTGDRRVWSLDGTPLRPTSAAIRPAPTSPSARHSRRPCTASTMVLTTSSSRPFVAT